MRNVVLQQVIGTGSMRQGRVVKWRSILYHRGTNMLLLHGLTLTLYPFTATPGLTADMGGKLPVDFFNLFFTSEVKI